MVNQKRTDRVSSGLEPIQIKIHKTNNCSNVGQQIFAYNRAARKTKVRFSTVDYICGGLISSGHLGISQHSHAGIKR